MRRAACLLGTLGVALLTLLAGDSLVAGSELGLHGQHQLLARHDSGLTLGKGKAKKDKKAKSKSSGGGSGGSSHASSSPSDESIEYVSPAAESSIEEKVTVTIKTFRRNKCLGKLLKSIRDHVPGKPTVIIADDSGWDKVPEVEGGEKIEVFDLSNDEDYMNDTSHAAKPGKINLFRLPHDVGLSAGRNFLVKKSTTDYFVLLDDDFLLRNESVRKLYSAITASGFDMVGGSTINDKYKTGNFCRSISVKGGKYSEHKNRVVEGNLVTRCDKILNFFIGKTVSVAKVLWDPKLKLLEHEDFFLRAKEEKLKIGYTAAVVEHYHEKCSDDSEYSSKRRNSERYACYFGRKWQLKEVGWPLSKCHEDLTKPAPSYSSADSAF